MADIITELTRLETAKSNIKQAIQDKGVDVPNNKLLSDYAEFIQSISGSGSSSTSSNVITFMYTPTSNTELLPNNVLVDNGITDIDMFCNIQAISMLPISFSSNSSVFAGMAWGGRTSSPKDNMQTYYRNNLIISAGSTGTNNGFFQSAYFASVIPYCFSANSSANVVSGNTYLYTLYLSS